MVFSRITSILFCFVFFVILVSQHDSEFKVGQGSGGKMDHPFVLKVVLERDVAFHPVWSPYQIPGVRR